MRSFAADCSGCEPYELLLAGMGSQAELMDTLKQEVRALRAAERKCNHPGY